MAKRTFIDGRGGDWTVMDVLRGPGDGWLCFVATDDGARVRLPLAQAGRDWHRLRRNELSKLLDDALRATRLDTPVAL
jgi:hypothetical protein